MEEEKVSETIDMIKNVQQLITIEGESEEEIEKKIKECLKPFSETLKITIKDVEQTKKEQIKEIESHEEFVKILEPLYQHSDIKELIQKENELIAILKNDKLFSEKFYLVFKSLLDIINLILLEDLISVAKKKNKLQYEINIITENLKEKNIIKR